LQVGAACQSALQVFRQADFNAALSQFLQYFAQFGRQLLLHLAPHGCQPFRQRQRQQGTGHAGQAARQPVIAPGRAQRFAQAGQQGTGVFLVLLVRGLLGGGEEQRWGLAGTVE